MAERCLLRPRRGPGRGAAIAMHATGQGEASRGNQHKKNMKVGSDPQGKTKHKD